MDTFQNTGQPDWEWWGRLWPTPGATLRRLGVTEESTVAEVACGNGYFALPLARITAPNPVYALDIDESLLAELSDLAEQHGINNVHPLHGDARDLTAHLTEPVDVILLANTFHGIDDMDGFLSETFDTLRPGGELIVVNWHDQPRETTSILGEPRGPPTDLRLSPETTEAMVLDAAEFSLEEYVELPPYHYGLIFER